MYEYTKEDLLNSEPYHYMYTPYGGLDFLVDYQASRQAFLRRHAQGYGKPQGQRAYPELVVKLGSYRIEEHRPRAGKAYSEAVADHPDGFETLETLYRMAEFLVDEGDVESALFLQWCDGFLRRFEVTKRLSAYYSHKFRGRRGDSAPIEAYALLAFVLAHIPPGKVDLRRINALLKLNDLLISCARKTTGSIAEVLMAKTIALELDLVRGLMRENGIVLSEGI